MPALSSFKEALNWMTDKHGWAVAAPMGINQIFYHDNIDGLMTLNAIPPFPTTAIGVKADYDLADLENCGWVLLKPDVSCADEDEVFFNSIAAKLSCLEGVVYESIYSRGDKAVKPFYDEAMKLIGEIKDSISGKINKQDWNNLSKKQDV